MHISLLDILRCSDCGGRYTASHSAGQGRRIEYAVLACQCRRIPVVAGILIFAETAGVAQLSREAIVQLIESGRGRAALLALVMPVDPPGESLAPEWARKLPDLPGLRRVRFLAQRWELGRWRREARQLLTDYAHALAMDLLDLHYHRSGSPHPNVYDYFAYRFGQPRYLVALALASQITAPSWPILELACGFGHITSFLTQRSLGQQVVGIDINFLALYIAQHWIAPEANYLCAPADQPLPFDADTFAATLCSDGFHYFSDKQTAVAEMQRVLRPDGMILLAVLRNALFDYAYAGRPLTPEGYRRLLGDMPARLIPDLDLLERYLQGAGPALASPAAPEAIVASPTLSIVASHERAHFRDHGRFDEWPHAEGAIQINPIYTAEADATPGHVLLRRRFISEHYAHDHGESADYLPDHVVVSDATLATLNQQRQRPEVEALIAHCVAIHIPERYI